MKFSAGLFLLACALAAQTCAPADTLLPVDSVSGSLDDSQCRLSDGALFAEYALTLATRGQLRLEVSSDDFTATIALRDAAGHKILGNSVEAGRYTVVVASTAPGQNGKFLLRSAFTPEPATLCREFPRMGLNQSVTRRLTPASCRLPDQSPFDAFTVNPFGSGTLVITMESQELAPFLLLRSDSGRLLTASDDATAGSAQISFPVRGDQSYAIVASSTASAAGEYRLTLKFTPADDETCRPLKSFSASGQDNARISGASCTTTFPDTGAQAPYNLYELELAENGLAELRLSTSAFDPLLTLLDAAGNLIATDTISGGAGQAIIRQQLKPGRYTVQVFSGQPSGGDYTLEYTFRPGPPEVCPVLTAQPGATITGVLSGASSCRTSEGVSDVYRIALASSGTLEMLATSGDFDPVLVLRDSRDDRIVADQNVAGGTDAAITADLAAGEYSVVIASSGAPGGYSFGYKLTPHPLPSCAQRQSLPLNSAFLGRLGPGSCRASNGQPLDFYEFTLPSSGVIAAVMTSPNLDSFLTLEDLDGNVLRRDDNGFGSPDALILQFLPAGTYRLGARAAESTAGGLYRIDLLSAPGDRPAGCAPLRTLGPGDRVDARLFISSCQFLDSTLADIYQLNVTDSADLEIRLGSGEFDAFLVILDAKGNVLDTDDDSDGDTNARILRNFDPGTYFIVVKPSAELSSTGNYSLEINPR